MRKLIEPRLQRMYDNLKQDFQKRYDFTEEEITRTYLDNPAFKVTKSKRIWRLIILAYCLGHLKGISYCDEMMNTTMRLSGEVE